MLNGLRILAVAIMAIVVVTGCGGSAGKPPPASTVSAPEASPSDLSTITPGDSGGPGSTMIPAGAPTPTPAPDVQRYLTVARQAFPERDDAELVDEAGIICARLSDNPSTHDVVGDLAAQLGNQTQAQQLVEAATAAYCPSAG